MLLTIALILLVLWALGAVVVPVGSGLIPIRHAFSLSTLDLHLGIHNPA
jgi:hypothetical protein